MRKALSILRSIWVLCALLASTIGICTFYIICAFPSRWARKHALTTVSHILLWPTWAYGTRIRILDLPKELEGFIIANHMTYCETFIITHYLKTSPLIFIKYLFSPLASGAAWQDQRIIWVHRTQNAMRSVVAATKNSQSKRITWMPEGTRRPWQSSMKCLGLTALICQAAPEKKIHPVVHNAHEIFRIRGILPSWPGTITLKFLPAFLPNAPRSRDLIKQLNKIFDDGKKNLPGLACMPVSISVQTLKNYMDERRAEMCIIDVRSEREAQLASMPSAHLLHPDMALDFCQSELEKNKRLIFPIICHHGVRSLQTVELLRSEGIAACNVIGGIDAWSRHIDSSVPQY